MSEKTIYQVVINSEEYYSVWPIDKEIPLGWKALGFEGDQDSCVKYIEEKWKDMRPKSVRNAFTAMNN